MIQQVSREILDEAGERCAGADGGRLHASPAPAPTPVPPTPVTPTPVTPGASPVSPAATPPQGSVAPTVPVFAAQAAPGEQVYIVRSGDTLYSIARRFGVTVQALQQRNNLANPNDIKVGQQLIIPAP